MKQWEKCHQAFIFFEVLNTDLNSAAWATVLEAVPPLYVLFGSMQVSMQVSQYVQ